ncbi:MAG: tail fiber protein [Pseudomonadota bacterium]
MDPFIGEIRLFGFNFAPRDWAPCDGRTLTIQSNTALFSILGITYGGNGTTTFALPNLNGHTPIGVGQGAGLSEYVLGEIGGSPSVTLIPAEMPAHNHSIGAVADTGNRDNLAAGRLAQSSIRSDAYQSTSNATMTPGAVAPTGGGQPHNNMPPFLGMHFCIALRGVFPARN